MALSFKHKFISAKVDSLDSSRVQPSNWNDEHDLLMGAGAVIGRDVGIGAGAAAEIPMGVTGKAILAAATQVAARTAVGADDTQTTIAAAATKTTPVDGDVAVILDSAAANVIKRVTWANIKATLKAYFDTLYPSNVNGVFSGQVTFANYIASSTATAVFAATGAGQCYFRPNGIGSAVGQMFVASSGNMTVNGTISATGDITSSSDERLKKDIKLVDLTFAKEMVSAVDPVSFKRKSDDSLGIGFIAQVVERYTPELVAEGDDGMKSVAYPNMVAILWRVVQDQQERIAALEASK